MRASFFIWIGVGVIIIASVIIFFFFNKPMQSDSLAAEAEALAVSSFQKHWQKCVVYQSIYVNPITKEQFFLGIETVSVTVVPFRFPPKDGVIWRGRVEFSSSEASRFPSLADSKKFPSPDGSEQLEFFGFPVTKDTKPIPFWTVTLTKTYRGWEEVESFAHPALVGGPMRDDSGNQIPVLPEYFTPEQCARI